MIIHKQLLFFTQTCTETKLLPSNVSSTSKGRQRIPLTSRTYRVRRLSCHSIFGSTVIDLYVYRKVWIVNDRLLYHPYSN